jgi:heme/copper-type cytochrome/quinol oxidase subunit 2
LAYSYSKILIFFILTSLTVLGMQSVIQIAQAVEEGGEVVIRRVAIWDLFYRMMVVAFAVGAVVQGVQIYTTWRFRESHPRFKASGNLGGTK